ncbi:hypothetical protein HK102_001870, partial [Quaeritorhiza haematococci]
MIAAALACDVVEAAEAATISSTVPITTAVELDVKPNKPSETEVVETDEVKLTIPRDFWTVEPFEWGTNFDDDDTFTIPQQDTVSLSLSSTAGFEYIEAEEEAWCLPAVELGSRLVEGGQGLVRAVHLQLRNNLLKHLVDHELSERFLGVSLFSGISASDDNVTASESRLLAANSTKGLEDVEEHQDEQSPAPPSSSSLISDAGPVPESEQEDPAPDGSAVGTAVLQQGEAQAQESSRLYASANQSARLDRTPSAQVSRSENVKESTNQAPPPSTSSPPSANAPLRGYDILFVKRLPATFSSFQVRVLFSAFGEIKRVVHVKEKRVAFIQF